MRLQINLLLGLGTEYSEVVFQIGVNNVNFVRAIEQYEHFNIRYEKQWET